MENVKKTYPELIKLMQAFKDGKLTRSLTKGIKKLHKNDHNTLKYCMFLEYKNHMTRKEFFEQFIKTEYTSEFIKSEAFGEKTTYKTNIDFNYWDLWQTI